MSRHLTTYRFARLKITTFFPTSLEYETIAHRMYKPKETTATCCANHPRLYLFIAYFAKLFLQTENLETTLRATKSSTYSSPNYTSKGFDKFAAPL